MEGVLRFVVYRFRESLDGVSQTHYMSSPCVTPDTNMSRSSDGNPTKFIGCTVSPRPGCNSGWRSVRS